MRNTEPKSADEVVIAYAKAASAHRRATEAGDHKKANKAYQVIATLCRTLRQMGPEAQRSLLVLLDHTDPGVRSWASAHALEFAPSDAERVLAALARSETGFISLDARMTLRHWREGKLQFP